MSWGLPQDQSMSMLQLGLGGVEMHIYQLSECLIQRGHKALFDIAMAALPEDVVRMGCLSSWSGTHDY